MCSWRLSLHQSLTSTPDSKSEMSRPVHSKSRSASLELNSELGRPITSDVALHRGRVHERVIHIGVMRWIWLCKCFARPSRQVVPRQTWASGGIMLLQGASKAPRPYRQDQMQPNGPISPGLLGEVLKRRRSIMLDTMNSIPCADGL